MTSAQSFLGRVANLNSSDLGIINEKQDEVTALTQNLHKLKIELSVDRSKYELAKQLDARRVSLTQNAAALLKFFEQPEVRAYLSTAGTSDLNSLVQKTDERYASKLTTVAFERAWRFDRNLSARSKRFTQRFED